MYMITFHNATDIDGRIIHIDEVTKDNRAEHYYCVGCGGEMSAVLGEKRDHHFRHKEAHCSWESYLHKLGKMRLKQRFDTQKEFVVTHHETNAEGKHTVSFVIGLHTLLVAHIKHHLDIALPYYI